MIKDLFESKTFRGVLYDIGICIIALAIFQLGIMVGAHKARFADRFAGAYEKNFIDSRTALTKRFSDERTGFGGHGAAGEIISIEPPEIIVSGPDQIERAIIVQNSTFVKKFQQDAKIGDLAVGDFIAVLGAPTEDGKIQAKLIRILPADMQPQNPPQSWR